MNDLAPDAYALRCRLPGVAYDEAVTAITAALGDEGFGVLTTIDVRATLEKKIGVEFRRYTILGACNPHLAHRALEAELEIGLLLPCNVVVYETDDGSVVSIADPDAMLAVTGNASLASIAAEARERLERALAAVCRGADRRAGMAG